MKAALKSTKYETAVQVLYNYINVFLRLFARYETAKSWFGYTPVVSSETVKEYMGKITNYDSSKSKDVLGWNPMDLEDSIRDTLNWIKHKFN